MESLRNIEPSAESSSEEELMDVRVKKEVQVIDKTERCLQILNHASKCQNPKCFAASCLRMKMIIDHSRQCGNRIECVACRQLLALCFHHASQCKEKQECKVTFCEYLRPIYIESLLNAI
ncbi:hypothetical protein QR680_014492 [Steinernema hermaphroditum]|uniref:histone acetyltransferase n=1 Tax=Steinernema hermaphroditum TaxID=289476 RepID=A0AA39IBB7_9BILA|nr:hypothetical protein QR680_014492 [Steinernema hermaphroditum]